MNGTTSNAFRASSKLGDLFASLPVNDHAQQWIEIELTAQSLANDLRVHDVDQQTALGKTLLPQTLTSLLKSATDGAALPKLPQKPAIFELLRVGANLCMDHDENRSYLLEAGFPQTVLALLEGYAESVKPSLAGIDPLPLSIADLKIVKTAIGVLLNASFGYEPVKTRLVSLEAALTVLKLSVALYPAGAWLRAKPTTDEEGTEGEKVLEEAWSIRNGLSQWTWRAISELREEQGEETKDRLVFSPDVLPFLVPSLQAFVPPYAAVPPAFAPALARTLVSVDYLNLEESCGLLESLCMDVEDVRLALARGLTFPAEHDGVPVLAEMLRFVDAGDYPPHWGGADADALAARRKGFDRCKAAVIKAVVEVAGEEKNTDVLWDDSDPATPGGPFVDQMVRWVRAHAGGADKSKDRDDLVICATLSLGNVVRKDAHSAAVVDPPMALAPDLASLLVPEADIQVKHGVVGLLKNLSQVKENRSILGKAGIIQKLAASGLLSDKADMLEMAQVYTIGIAKHMCNGEADNTLALLLPDSARAEEPSLYDQILALVRRSDTVAVKSEGTRVFVNATKTLWSADGSSKEAGWAQRRKAAMEKLVTPPCAAALAQLIGRSKKYAILINEGVVALSLLSTHSNGGLVVLDAIMNPLPVETPRGGAFTVPVSAGPATDSPVAGTPRRALDMLVSCLRNADGRVPAEVRANICALVGHLGRPGVVPESRGHDLRVMQEELRELLEAATKDANPVGTAAKRALETWGK
ncbi:uncharacterized protein PHACADRAFT_256013 [Phanerochaete carnosa HHB-10118-sp]|uniref:Uncharacterized protein n=1 Tax=Phanerochaete carnosa (strain HHB-10118-sp) TaxID=650164 RepID=K5W8B1_PHACS|nr:uncharacterized protein PHACADRAFT_256013 [Phanerochaete carnosa HHB-10118-sp]EKM55405.1 hypothetical protein PHACADRAFT_256013 [Phanerochaete carnosa HHB-10118-sp]